MADIASRLAKSTSMWRELCRAGCRREGVSWMMTMLTIFKTVEAKIIIVAILTVDKPIFGENYKNLLALFFTRL
jgi:hypothetical protein